MANENIAHIKDGNEIFQVINETGDDWDEEATKELYRQWLLSKA